LIRVTGMDLWSQTRSAEPKPHASVSQPLLAVADVPMVIRQRLSPADGAGRLIGRRTTLR
jgi:hypothetical protein